MTPQQAAEAPARAETAGVTQALAALSRRRRDPLTTYRLQLNGGFGFRAAAAVLNYLHDLGVTDCYTSPLLKARHGSAHGYDITDHNHLNPELGSEGDYERFAARLAGLAMGHLLDFVPNHMGLEAAANPWWRDVLENGPASRYADYFDIDWDPSKPELKNKVLLPILGDQYGSVLERGELRLLYDDGRFSLSYFERRLPIDPRESPRVLRHGLETLQKELEGDPRLTEFLSILTELANIPPRSRNDAGKVAERGREMEVARGRLKQLAAASPRIRRHIRDALAFFNGKAGEPRSFDPLHELLEAQAYRLSYWKTASHEINYRRFFDINDLAGLRMENAGVFDATHGLILRLLAEGKVTGLRIDHPDGLYDPGRYFDRLQGSFLRAWLRRRLRVERALTPEEDAALEAWRAEELRRDFKGLAARPLYVAGEKILSPGETLDPHWAVDGTSGYDFLNDLNSLFVDPAGARPLREFYGELTGKRAPLDMVVYVSKKLIASTSMSSELSVLADLLNRISERDRRTRDFTLQSLREALRDVAACFPVYRTYITPALVSARDREVVDLAISRARRRNPVMEPSIFQFIRSLLLPAAPDPDAKAAAERLEFVMKFQQYTAPVQAKGLEDTAFYRYNVLVSLNEVGADPSRFGLSAAQFHQANGLRARDWPRSMLATATHDTKRGEDARLRIDLLSEIPAEWKDEVLRWSEMNRTGKGLAAGEAAPDANDEYLFYQALLGAWDFAREDAAGRAALCERLKAYMGKAVKEEKLKTSWIAPDEEYEKETAAFIDRVFANEEFLRAFRAFARRVAALAAVHSLSQLAIKTASPGVADFYQGTELWDLSLVDPDNRRPVDYAVRRQYLASAEPHLGGRKEGAAAFARELLAHWEDGRVKLFATAALLRQRRARRALFFSGSYQALEIEGGGAERFLAFAREWEGERVLVAAPRLIGGALWQSGPAGLSALAKDLRLRVPAGWEGPFRDVVTGAPLPATGELSPLFNDLPFAFLSNRPV